MKLIKPSVEILEQAPGIQGVYEAICKAASTCYKSAPKSGEDAETFVRTLIKCGHNAMLEFGTVYLAMPVETMIPIECNEWGKYCKNKYSRSGIVCEVNGEQRVAVTTNYRVIVENEWFSDLKYMCEPTEYHAKRYTAKFVISIGTGREFLRHRTFSFANESTRYCNYSREKFAKNITFVVPRAIAAENDFNKALSKTLLFTRACKDAETAYMQMLDNGATPQEAREVLPLCTKSELCMCGFEGDWKHFFDLRMRGTTGKPHPDAMYIAENWYETLKNKGIKL